MESLVEPVRSAITYMGKEMSTLQACCARTMRTVLCNVGWWQLTQLHEHTHTHTHTRAAQTTGTQAHKQNHAKHKHTKARAHAGEHIHFAYVWVD